MFSLKVVKNKIVDSKNKEFIFRGICINSPGILKYEEDHDFLEDIKEIKKLGANAVKIPICPAYWQYNKNYCQDILDPIVKLTKKLNLYCCLDWHAQGNPFTNKTREYGNILINGFEKYDANQKLALKALQKISKRYGQEKHIIFDPFSMPIDIENDKWRVTAQKFTNLIRKNSNNLIIINGTNWASDLSWVLNNPIKSSNVVYGYAYYPQEMFQDLSTVLLVKKTYPVIFPECGYTNNGYFKGTKKDYGRKLKQYTKNGFGFFAWAYHPQRVPIILNSWRPNDLTEWGKFLTKELL